jgi:chromosome segregation ATPase
MGFFTVGNLITLVIVVLILILYRQADKKNRTLSKLRDYSDKLKGDLAAFAEEKAAAVRDYGVNLEVERQSAANLMKKLQEMTEKELAQKAQAIMKIDERISAYDASLNELVKMTERVQENLARIREESPFVENVGKRIGEAKDQLAVIEKEMGSLERRFQQENSEVLEKSVRDVVSSVKSAVTDLEVHAETIERQVEDHREAVDRIERDRAASLARDMALVNKTLKEAVEKAGQRADKMEEAALVKLKEQAQERIHKLQSGLEEKLKAGQENGKNLVADMQERLKGHRDEWKSDIAGITEKQKQFRDEWKKDVQALSAMSSDAEKKVLEEADQRLEQYKQAQTEQYRQLASLADDMARLDGELRLSMDETVRRVREDFARFEAEASADRRNTLASFTEAAKALSADMNGVEQELNVLKNKAYENVSEKLKVFEDDFFDDISKRSGEIDRRLAEFQSSLDSRLNGIASDGEKDRQNMEASIAADLRSRLTALSERLIADLEHLKNETGAFEEGVRAEMQGADESRRSFMEQLERDLLDARQAAEDSVKTEVGRYALTMGETLKQRERDIETRLEEISGAVESRSAEFESLIDNSRRNGEEWQTASAARMRDLEASMDEVRRRARELAAESDEKTASIRSSLDSLKGELSDQARLFDKSGELKRDLERRIEDVSADLDRLEQRKSEIAQIENKFIALKRLEDDVNNKMTRFISEKRRIEGMEESFNRLLQTSEAVEVKLAQVNASDDSLQAVQLQLRRLDEVIRETEEKYQRMERKSQVLDETNDGIDKNFQVLTETETALKQAREDLDRIFADMETVRVSVQALSDENEKAQETAGKLGMLDQSLTTIEKRIKEMQTAREMLARMETRFEKLTKDAQAEVNLIDALVKEGDGKPRRPGGGAPTIRDRENIIKLKRKGWTIEQIAKSMGISQGEVELILELPPKD